MADGGVEVEAGKFRDALYLNVEDRIFGFRREAWRENLTADNAVGLYENICPRIGELVVAAVKRGPAFRVCRGVPIVAVANGQREPEAETQGRGKVVVGKRVLIGCAVVR